MSVFKKLVSFLFEEEEEVYEEGELENISIQEEKRKPEVIRTQSVPPVKKQAEERFVEQPKRVVEEPIVQLPPEAQKHFTNIEVAKEVPVKTPQRVQRATPQRAVQRNVEASKPAEFEFIPVISPIFGADEQHTKNTSPKSVSVPQHRVTQPTIVKKNPLGTIISPIYGATELAEFEMEAKERIENMELKAAQPPVAFDNDEIDDEEDDAISVPLEDLLASDERDEEDDLLQFSLFGDDEVVSSETIKDSYTIKE